MAEREGKDGESTEPVALEEHLDLLYSVPPSEFVRQRAAISSRLKAQGRGAEAAQVTRAAKPTLSAWLTNRVCVLCDEEFEAFLATSRALRDAQRRADRDAVKVAGESHRAALERLLERAADELAGSGAGGDARVLVPRVRTNLQALSVAELGSGARRLAGRLEKDLEAPSFDQLMALGPVKRLDPPAPASADQATGKRRPAAPLRRTAQGPSAPQSSRAKKSTSPADSPTPQTSQARRRAERELESAQQRRAAAERAVAVVEARLAEAQSALRLARDEERKREQALRFLK